MQDLNAAAFVNLFHAACEKCFGHPLIEPLSETDSKLLSTTIFEKTGLTIGAKSIRNYSLYVLDPTDGRKENPSIATLDTFARYVLNAPLTDELKRKNNESHHPYWYRYRSEFSQPVDTKPKSPSKRPRSKFVIPVMVMVVAIVVYLVVLRNENHSIDIVENFDSVSEEILKEHGWHISAKTNPWWLRKNDTAGHLTLFTLRGDNWQTSERVDRLQNVLLRKIAGDCFNTEVHFSNFVPRANWQQAGLLLAEDSTLQGKVIRISVSYNDFFGGYQKSPEIIFQGLSSTESTGTGKPEEFAHIPIFALDDQQDLVINNLTKTTLKIEKRKNSFRFLIATGSGDLFAYKEIARGDFSIDPKYIALFATEGNSTGNEPLAVKFDSFSFEENVCER